MRMSEFKSAVKFIFRIWVIVTSVIGSFFVFALMILVGLASSLSEVESSPLYPTRTVKQGGTDKIAILNLSGVIMDDDASSDPFSFSEGIISARKVIPMLDHVREDESVKAVVIRVNSPGGAVVASDEIAQKIMQLKEKKPVIVNFGDVSASGGYYISAPATEIIANPATLTGSIGVIAQFPQFSGLYEKVGVGMRTFKSGEFKDIGSPDRELTEPEQVILQTMINEAYDQFVQVIVDGRKMDESRVRQLADGRIYTGKQAKENGLIDGFGNVDVAINRAKELANVNDPTILEYTSKSFFESLISSTSKQVNPLSSMSSFLPQQRSGVYYMMSL